MVPRVRRVRGDAAPAVSTATVWLCLNTVNGNVQFGSVGATSNCPGSNVVARQAYLVPTTRRSALRASVAPATRLVLDAPARAASAALPRPSSGDWRRGSFACWASSASRSPRARCGRAPVCGLSSPGPAPLIASLRMRGASQRIHGLGSTLVVTGDRGRGVEGLDEGFDPRWNAPTPRSVRNRAVCLPREGFAPPVTRSAVAASPISSSRSARPPRWRPRSRLGVPRRPTRGGMPVPVPLRTRRGRCTRRSATSWRPRRGGRRCPAIR